ncbi:MAG: peptidoglycan-associated lipoprotein Pal [Rhodospirillaceae bacterium]|nr:peptidoglycan-associated lipoprotein Pal [Rhodospirillaceae bacterium]
MRLKVFPLFAAVLLLVACGSSEETVTTGGGGTVVTPSTGGPRAGTIEDFQVNVGDRVFFALDSSELSGEARSTLDRQAAWLNQYPQAQLRIEGHCDERGTREYNLALGDRRANAVRNYLVAQGISASRLDTISYGKERPAVVGSNESSWAQNRRGVSVITSGAPIN